MRLNDFHLESPNYRNQQPSYLSLYLVYIIIISIFRPSIRPTKNLQSVLYVSAASRVLLVRQNDRSR